jgi:hypothetical protein
MASILFGQVGGVLAAPVVQSSDPVIGMVQKIILETDSTTGVTIVIVDLLDDSQLMQSVRVSQETAIGLGLVALNGDGKSGINRLALGKMIEIDPDDVIPAEERSQHPVGSALTTYFSDIAGLDYESIMAVHEQGIGFGAIAEMLWLTRKLEANLQVFETLVHARQTGNYEAFILADGSTPKNWGQLRKSILENSNALVLVLSNKEKNDGNSGNGGGNGNGNGHD